MDAGSPAESPKDVEPEPSLSEPAVSPSSAAACPAGPAGPVPLGAALAAPATVTMAYPKAPAFTPVRTASHGPVRMSRSMVIPAEQFAAPKAWVFHGSGGSLPCAQSFQPLQRVVSTTSYTSHPAWPGTPRFIAHPGAVPVAPCPGVVHVVRELSPGRPPAVGTVAPQRAVSPPAVPSRSSMSGPVSPPIVAPPRSLSPRGTATGVPSAQAHTPLMPGQQLVSPRAGTPCRLQPLSSHLPSPRERALSPVGLPPVPVFAKIPQAALAEMGQLQRCPSPRPVVIKTVTPRVMPGAMRSTVPVMTPRPLPMEVNPKAATPQRQPAPKPCVIRTTSRPSPKAPGVKRQASRGKATPSVAPPGRGGKVSEDQTSAGQLPPRLASRTSQLPHNGTAPAAPHMTATTEVAVLVEDPCFVSFAGILGEPGAVEATCQQLLSRLRGGSSVRWEELVNMNPTITLLELGLASSPARKAVKVANQEEVEDKSQDCQGWWRAMLARHGLYGPGDVLGAPELAELIAATLRYLRDRYAPAAFLRNLRTVHCGSKRLKELYGSFEFHSRGMQGKSYRCRSRLTREEHICRQVCKDKVPAPSDLVRAEVEMLRGLEHPAIPQVIASFEDFNNIYIVLEPVESVELVHVLQQWHWSNQGLSVGWLAEIARQLLEAFRHCHEMRPHSLVHGDLRLTSLLLSAQTDAKMAPQLVLADLGLAGLPAAPPALEKAEMKMTPDWRQCPSPLLDVWSCGCLIFMLLSGRHPFDGDPGGRLLPSASYSALEPDWRMLPSASSASLCAQMLSWDLKSRPSAAECLRHSWLSAEDSHDVAVPMEALGNLLKSHHRSKLQEITAGLAISEQITSPFSAIGAALALEQAFGCSKRMTVPVKDAEAALKSLGMSEKGMEKVLKAFSDDSSFSYGLLELHCSELAEDLLDHALWRVFSAAGEDHRGVLGAAELEKALQQESGSSGADRAGGEAPGPFGNEMKASEIVRQISTNGQEVTFEELKAAIIQRQSRPLPSVKADS